MLIVIGKRVDQEDWLIPFRNASISLRIYVGFVSSFVMLTNAGFHLRE
jgi:hypothetical protein